MAKYFRNLKMNKRILETKFVIQINGQDIIGPMQFESLYMIAKYGGKRRGEIMVIEL